MLLATVLSAAHRYTSAMFAASRNWSSASDDLKVRITESHLWLEERLSGDTSIDLDRQVFANIDGARALCQALLAGGRTEGGELEQALGSGAAGVVDQALLSDAVVVLREEFDRGSRPATRDDEVVAGRPPSPGAARKILAIDDSPLIRGVVRIALEGQQGWRVWVARSAEEGLALALHERPDTILLDVELPGLDGRATMMRLHAKESAREIPVLFLTGHVTPEDRARLEALGAAGVIAKPFDPASLAAEIGGLLGWA